MLGFLLGLIGLIALPIIGLIVGVAGTLYCAKDLDVAEFYKIFVKKRTWKDREQLINKIKEEL